jgi:hypothetical protein
MKSFSKKVAKQISVPKESATLVASHVQRKQCPFYINILVARFERNRAVDAPNVGIGHEMSMRIKRLLQE